MSTLLLLFLTFGSPPADAKKPPPVAAWRVGDAVADEHKKGMLALTSADWAAAEASFKLVLAAEPECGQALTGLGRAMVMQGRAVEALTPLQSATRLFADQLEAHLWHAKAAAATGDRQTALSEAKAAIGVKAGNVDAQRVAQGVLREEKRHDEAHAMLATARVAANNPAFDCMEGVLFAREGKLGDAQRMGTTCSGVPDTTLYSELTREISEAVTRSETEAVPAP